MKSVSRLGVVLVASSLVIVPATSAAVVGSEAVSRALLDSTNGLSLIYRGPTTLMSGGEQATNFSFYSGRFSTHWVTPFITELTGTNSYTVVAIGTSRQTDSAGVFNFDFDAIAGSAVTEAGKTYSIGFTNAAYTADGTGGVTLTAGTDTSGAVTFDGYGDFSDNWSYAFAGGIQLGTIFGDGGVGFDLQGFAGRIYSANIGFEPIPTPATLALIGAAGLNATRRRRSD